MVSLESIKVKPCPFCGGKPVFTEELLYDPNENLPDPYRRLLYQCTVCGASGSPVMVKYTEEDGTILDGRQVFAMLLWNNRIADPESEVLSKPENEMEILQETF